MSRASGLEGTADILLLLQVRDGQPPQSGSDMDRVQRLVADGWIGESSGHLNVTEKGRLHLSHILTKMLPQLNALAKAVSAPDMIDTLPLLGKIRQYLSKIGD